MEESVVRWEELTSCNARSPYIFVYGEGVVGGGGGEMFTVRICVGALMSEKVED